MDAGRAPDAGPRRRTTRGAVTAVAAMVAVALLAGCSGRGDGGPSASPSPTDSSTSTDIEFPTSVASPTASPSPSTAGLTTVTDDSGQISMVAPTEWEVDGRPRPVGGGSEFLPSLIVAEDINRFETSTRTPGNYLEPGVSIRVVPSHSDSLTTWLDDEVASFTYGCQPLDAATSYSNSHLSARAMSLSCGGDGPQNPFIKRTSLVVARGGESTDAVVVLRFRDNETSPALQEEIWASLDVGPPPAVAPSPTPIPTPLGFVRVTDDTGQIALAVPAEWEVDGTSQSDAPDGTPLPGLVAAPLVSEFLRDSVATGISIEVMPADSTADGDLIGEQVAGEGCYGQESNLEWSDGHLGTAIDDYPIGDYRCESGRTIVQAAVGPDGVAAMVKLRATDEVWEEDIPSQIYATITLGS